MMFRVADRTVYIGSDFILEDIEGRFPQLLIAFAWDGLYLKSLSMMTELDSHGEAYNYWVWRSEVSGVWYTIVCPD